MTEQYVLSKKRVVDAQGVPYVGAKLYVYEAGTTTPLDTYSDDGLSIANTNPIESDSAGIFSYIFLATDDYKFVLTDANDNVVWTQDDYKVNATLTFSGGLEQVGDTVQLASGADLQTGTSYTIQAADRGNVIVFSNASPISVTLPAAGTNFPDGWYAYIQNINDGLVTITSTSNIDGAGSITLARNEGVRITSSGTTYYSVRGAQLGVYFKPNTATLTIATGVITVNTFDSYTVDTEGAAASDDLVTINGAANGKVITLRTAADARDVVLKHNTGNIFNPAAQDITLGKTQDIVMLRYDSNLSRWVVLAYNNAINPSLLKYRSTAQTLTAGTELTLAHGLNQIPDNVVVQAVCTTSDLGYSIGERIIIPSGVASATSSPSVNTGMAVKLDNTNIKIRIAPDGVTIPRGDAADPANMTLTSWQFYFNAYYIIN